MNKYTREEAVKAATKYFGGDSLAGNVWTDKYSLKDSEGNIYEKTPDDMHWRLARELARIEAKYPNPMSEEQIFGLLKEFRYLVPQGGPMAGIGNNFVTTSLSNCFVIPSAKDSYSGIMKTDQEQVQVMRRRGGCGHDISTLRPHGTTANGAKLKGNTGSTLFMERFSNSTRETAQDSRRGALMLSMDIKHPDAERFIDMKVDTNKVTGANISVRISDDYMESVKHKGKFKQQFPIDSEKPIMEKEIESKKLWDKIIHNAWKSAEPGILFWDNILNESPAKGYGEDWKETSTNPLAN
jgi:ribonucleoside-diphosphate reductase alpha chain